MLVLVLKDMLATESHLELPQTVSTMLQYSFEGLDLERLVELGLESILVRIPFAGTPDYFVVALVAAV
jgi:hypothetical protein